ncbi:MAG TPA: porin [Kofleriaceae bacterium]|nr:porin [Kofleriaceae bacterium]
MKLSHVVWTLLLVRSIAAAQPAPDQPQPQPSPQPSPSPSPSPSPQPSPLPSPLPSPQPPQQPAAELLPPARPPAPPPPDIPTVRATSGRDDLGFYIRSADGASVLRLGGYMQFDGRYFFDDDANALTNQFAFRSIRPELRGTLYQHYDFRLLPDFAGGKLVIQEAYVDLHYVDELEVRFGKYKVPFGLERLQPEVATTFVERGLPSLLTPNRDLGVEVFGVLAHGVVSYQLGVFDGIADNASVDTDTSDHKDLAARVFITPFAGGPPLVRALGFGGAATVGYDHGSLAQSDVGTWLTQGQNTFFQYVAGATPTLANTALADGRHVRATAQANWYAGPLGVLAEYVRSDQHVDENDHAPLLVDMDAWQVLAQYVVHGGTSTFQGVVPTDPCLGAFSVAARIGELRLLDNTVFTSGLADPTKSARKAISAGAGADWLPNKSLRFMLDLEHTEFYGGAKTGSRPEETSLIGRVQTVF